MLEYEGVFVSRQNQGRDSLCNVNVHLSMGSAGLLIGSSGQWSSGQERTSQQFRQQSSAFVVLC